MVIDVDAHQGNGVARDKLHWQDSDLFILDVYNRLNYPMDVAAKAGIDVMVELAPGTKDAEYLAALEAGLRQAAASGFSPDLVIYNAGALGVGCRGCLHAAAAAAAAAGSRLNFGSFGCRLDWPLLPACSPGSDAARACNSIAKPRAP